MWAVAASIGFCNRLERLSKILTRTYVSMCSLWEMAVKSTPGRRTFAPMSVADAVMHFERAGFELLEIRREHILAVATLPPLHGDPFERLLVAQAIS
jgi:PIN domain nuclease of toxin-antitoxin system